MNIIKRLRRKFILMATIAVIIVVVGVLGLINTIAYMRMNGQVESVLSYISQNGGDVPPNKMVPGGGWFGDRNWSDDTPDFSYQIRFFSVVMGPDEYVKMINTQNTVAFTKGEAIQYAQAIVQAGKTEGIFKKDRASYAYMLTKDFNGDFLIVIMDCTHDVDAVESFMRYSVKVGFVCIILYVIILAALCNIAIKPFIRNMENQKRFITNAGHELKTPIAIISTNTEAIEMINGKNQWTESILKQVQRLSNLINDLIILAKRGEGSHADLVVEKIDLSETVAGIAGTFRQMAEDQGKNLLCHIAPQVYIKSDTKCVYELINILVDNAIKYCDDGGSIDISLVKSKKKIADIVISNTYADGADTDYSRFFERFYRGDISHDSKKSGYGIGLSIAEELTQLLKGKINVSYTDGKIAFAVRLNTND